MQKNALNIGMRAKRIPAKLLLIVKLTTFLLMIALAQVSASTFAQKLTYSKRGASLKEIFAEIKTQTGYNVLYSPDQVDPMKKVNANFKQANLEQVLEKLIDVETQEYSIVDKNILIKEKEKSFLENVIARFQAIDVRGRVVDSLGNGLPGASVRVKGGKSVSTNANGEFYIAGVDEKAVLVISYVGYKPLEIVAKGQLGNITLEISNGELKEVVINKGYYTQKEELNTGSVSRINGEILRKQPINDPIAALEGRLPGVYVSQLNGVPGSKLNINIRGRNSIAAGLEPLFVINGIPYLSETLQKLGNAAAGLSPFLNIRPEDIEEITVLKDADATAIYGSRGANGVVLITTKKGNAGRSQFIANTSQGWGNAPQNLKLMNTAQYLEMRNEAFKNDGFTPQDYDYDVNGKWSPDRSTDWQKLMIGGTSQQTTANGSLSGGTEQTQFLVGGSFRNETTVFPGDFYNKVFGLNANINHTSLSKKFNVNFNSSYNFSIVKLPQTDFTRYIYMAPNAPSVYDQNGKINWEDNSFENPFAYTLRTSRNKMHTALSNVSSSYIIIPGLQAKVNAGFTSTFFNEINLQPFSSVIPSAGNAPENRLSDIGSSRRSTWIVEPQMNYHRLFAGHTLDAAIGAAMQENEQTGNTISAFGFPSDALLESNGVATNVSSTTNFSQYRYNSLYARIGYNYNDKYVLNLTGRRDGSSRFGPGKRYGNFGALGAAWIFSKEKLVGDNLEFLSFGKLRGSFGRTGNDQIGDYEFLDTYGPSGGYLGGSGLVPVKLANPEFRWETIDKLELALDLGFFNDRALLNINWFRNRTKNQLVGYPLPSITGFTTVVANLPAVIENKGFEFELSSKNIKNKAFSWTTSANITIPQNKLVSFPGIEATSYAKQYAVGMPLDVTYVYKYKGVDPNTGVFVMEDIDKDGEINSTGDVYPVTRNRSLFGGLGNTFGYKGFSLDIFFQFVKQLGTINIGPGAPSAPGTFFNAGASNFPEKYTNRWRIPGDVAQYQRSSNFLTIEEFVRYTSSDARTTDASFIRLKNVSLSWSIPKKWIERMKINSLAMFVQGQNLTTFTKYKGVDPEISGGTSLPPIRMITMGLNVSL